MTAPRASMPLVGKTPSPGTPNGRRPGGAAPAPRIGQGRPVLAIVESVALEAPLDPYLSLRALAAYASCSVRWLRDRVADADHPLPCYRLPGGKILVRRSAFDKWVNAYRAEGAEFAADVDRIVARLAR